MLTKDRKIQRSRFENSFAEVSDRIGIGVFDERAKTPIKKPGFGFFIFGVLLPALALWFEVCTHTLAGALFDPFPSIWHVLLFSFIPISNLIVFLAVRVNLVSFYAITSLTSGFAMGIAILYSLMFVTKLPALGSTFLTHSEMAFMVMFHPLLYAPLLSIIPLSRAGHVITLLGSRQKAFFDGDQLKHFGHIVILIMVLSIEAPSTITRIYLSKAVEPEFSNKQRLGKFDKDSVSWLRNWGSREVMLRACYERSGRATDILGSFYEDQHPVSVDDARSLFYLVTGQSFNETAIPASFRSTLKHTGAMHDASGLNGNADDEFDIDTDIAGSKVSGFARGLSTSDSSISGKVDAKTGFASLDWTCTFENATYVPREARAQVKLPPGACVSGATIWLDGQKKVATIDYREQARNTYVNSVYSHKKDPLLVSMVGPSTVLVQCYPVVRAQVTKIDLHIVAPLQITKDGKAQLVYPTFGERNFAFKNENKIHLNSDTKFYIKDNIVEFETVVQPNALSKQANPMPDSLVVVVDGSVKMQPYMSEVVEGLKTLPVKDVRILKVLDGETTYKNKDEALNDLANTKCGGGQDNSQALFDGLCTALLKANSPSAVLWIHSPQPVCQASEEQAIKDIFRSLKDSQLKKYVYDYQVTQGPNKLFEDMDLELSASAVREIASTGHPKADLEKFYSTLQPTNTISNVDFIADKNLSEDQNILNAHRATMNSFALYGYQSPLLHLCTTYHFVSPVTSLVVVPDENQLAYDEEVVNAKNAESNECTFADKVKATLQVPASIVTATGPVMESSDYPGRVRRDQEYSNMRESKKEKAHLQAPAAKTRMKDYQRKAERQVGGSIGGGGGRSNAVKDNKFICDSAVNLPASAPKSDFAPMKQLQGSVTDKLSSLSQAACQAGPAPMEESAKVDSRYGQSNEISLLADGTQQRRSRGFLSVTSIVTYLVVLVFGLIFISIFKSARLRK